MYNARVGTSVPTALFPWLIPLFRPFLCPFPTLLGTNYPFSTYLEYPFWWSWCEYPSTLVPGWWSTAHPLLLNPSWRHPQFTLHVYIGDITTSATLSDTLIFSACLRLNPVPSLSERGCISDSCCKTVAWHKEQAARSKQQTANSNSYLYFLCVCPPSTLELNPSTSADN
jgi:hypothetical protein